jgi:UPF0716 family protein affecting phage T7 exclusion
MRRRIFVFDEGFRSKQLLGPHKNQGGKMSADNLIGLAGNLIGWACICLPIIGLIVVLLLILPSTRGYIFAFVSHLVIKSRCDRAPAVIKQVDDIGYGWYVKHSDF